MALRFLVCGLMLVGFGAATRGDEKPAKAATHAGFERLKKMAGTWVEADKDGKPTKYQYTGTDTAYRPFRAFKR